jgi:dTDP-4-dehydrorhamnose reductase
VGGAHTRSGPVQPLLITGATGTLGQALAGACELRGLEYLLVDRATLPIDDAQRVGAFLDQHRPWAVVNAAGWVRVDDAEGEEAACLRANTLGALNLARACAERDIHCTIFSSDLVFDGKLRRPYVEADPPCPIGVYGRSKARAEQAVAQECPATLVVRTAAFFSPYDQHNFAIAVERALSAGRTLRATECIVTPTFVPDLVSACLDLVIDGEAGIWHLTNGEEVSWLEFGRRIAVALDLDPGLVMAASPEELGWRAPRPAYAPLASSRGRLLPSLADAIGRHAAVRTIAGEERELLMVGAAG